MRVTSKGQVTIPIKIREQVGIEPERHVALEVVGNGVQIRRSAAPTRGVHLDLPTHPILHADPRRARMRAQREHHLPQTLLVGL